MRVERNCRTAEAVRNWVARAEAGTWASYDLACGHAARRYFKRRHVLLFQRRVGIDASTGVAGARLIYLMFRVTPETFKAFDRPFRQCDPDVNRAWVAGLDARKMAA